MPKERSFRIPLKYIDVVRRTNATSDVLLESRIDDNWNVEGDLMLTGTWTGFVQILRFNEKPPDGYTWSGKRFTKVQAASRPHFFWPEVRSSFSQNSQQKEQQFWALEKPKLDNARKLKAIYYVDPDGMEFKDTMKNVRNKLNVSLETAMPCKLRSASLSVKPAVINIPTPEGQDTPYHRNH